MNLDCKKASSPVHSYGCNMNISLRCGGGAAVGEFLREHAGRHLERERTALKWGDLRARRAAGLQKAVCGKYVIIFKELVTETHVTDNLPVLKVGTFSCVRTHVFRCGKWPSSCGCLMDSSVIRRLNMNTCQEPTGV